MNDELLLFHLNSLDVQYHVDCDCLDTVIQDCQISSVWSAMLPAANVQDGN